MLRLLRAVEALMDRHPWSWAALVFVLYGAAQTLDYHMQTGF